MAEPVETKDARYGSRMIEVKVRFWTNDIAPGKGKIRPKHAWASGVVRMATNSAHGIQPNSPRMFRSLSDMPSVLEKVLIEHGIKLHPSNRAQKLQPKD